MDFLTFFLYFTASVIIHSVLKIGLRFVLVKYKQRQMKKFIKEGNVRMMSMEDVINELKQQAQAAEAKEEKKTWN